MPQIIVEQPNTPSMTVPLRGREVRVGRADDNEIVLVADEVSRHHAKLFKRGESFVIIDLNSLNGTYVNRQRISESPLKHLDEIWLGSKCRMVFRDDTRAGHARTSPRDAQLSSDLDKIREEMARVGDNLTQIATQTTPKPKPPTRGSAQQTPAPGTAAVSSRATPPAHDLEMAGRAYRRLDALYRASKLIASHFDLSKRLAALLDTAMEVMNAERGFIMLSDEGTGELRVTVARQMGRELEASSPSMGIAGRAAIDGEPVLMVDQQRDREFGGRESVLEQRIVSAMCVPLKVEDRSLGSIYVDTREPGRTFSEEDLELFATLGTQSAMAIDNAHLYEQMMEAEKRRADLGRFLSPGVVDQIMQQGARIELGGRKCIATVMFCDIRGFTPIAERIPPTELVEMLNEHFTAMTSIVFNFRGTLDKFIGDEIMAVFGSPLSAQDDALRCVQAALAMKQQNAALNVQRAREGRPTLELGFGINTGEVVAGLVGAPERMEFTVVGNHVNTARRLCAEATAGQVIMGEVTYAAVKNSVRARPLGTRMLKGKEEPVHAFELLCNRDQPDTDSGGTSPTSPEGF